MLGAGGARVLWGELLKIQREPGHGAFFTQLIIVTLEDDEESDNPFNVEGGTYGIDNTGRVWRLDRVLSGIVESALTIPPDDRPRARKRPRTRSRPAQK